MTRDPRSIVTAVARLVWFDLLRWWPVAATAVLLEGWRAADVEAALHFPPPGAGPVSLFPGGIATLDAILWLLPVATTMLVVQADHPDDDRAFWRTRPIAPAALAVAKIAFLALLFVLVPAAIDAIRLAAYGAPISSMLVATGQIAARAGFVILPAWALALATRTPSRFLGAAGALVVAAYLFALAANWIDPLLDQFRDAPARSRSYPAMLEPLKDWQRNNRHGWTGGLVLTATGLGILVALYATRRTVAAACAGVALVAAPNLWPAADGVSAASPAVGAAIGGRITLPAGLTLPARHWIERERDSVQVSGPVVLPGLPPHLSADITWERMRVGTGAETLDVIGYAQQELGATPTDVVRGGRAARDRGLDWLFKVPPRDALRLLVPRVSIDGEAVVSLTERRVVGAIPLAKGQAVRADGVLLEILEVKTYRDGPVAHVRLARFPSAGSAYDRTLTLFVTDARRGVALPTLTYWGGYREPPSSSVWAWGSSRTWVERFDMQLEGAAALVAQPGAELVLVESRLAGRLRTALRAHDVPMRPRD
jgi:hypothetical protein